MTQAFPNPTPGPLPSARRMSPGRILAAMGLAATVLPAATATAADRATDSFVQQARLDAQWHGIDARRIVRRGDQVTIYGQDGNGRAVVLHRSCGEHQISCLASRDDG